MGSISQSPAGSPAPGSLGRRQQHELCPAEHGGFPAHAGRSQAAILQLSLQWQPNDDLELYSDFLFTGYRNRHQVYFFIGFPRDGVGFAKSIDINLSPGSNAVSSTSTPGNFQLTSTQSFNDKTDGYQWASGLKWTKGNLKTSTDVVYNWNSVKNQAVIVDTQFVPPAGVTPTFTFDLTTPHGTDVSVSGADITDGDNFRFWGLFDNRGYATSKQTAWKLDFDYSIDQGFLKNIKTGIRVSDRAAHSRQSARNDIPPAAGRGVQVVTTVPGFGSPAPDGLFSTKQFGASNWFGGNADFQLDNADTVRGIFGLPSGPPGFNPTVAFDDTEKTYAGYVQAGYETEMGGKRVTGLFGVRIVKTDQSLKGFLSDGTPISGDSNQVDVLPVVNAKVNLEDNLLLRFSAGRSITRPNFSDLNPVVDLRPGTTTNPLGNGSGGNPDLDTVKSDNFDVSIENYFSKSSYVSLTGFYRRIDGYVQTFASNETHVVNGVSGQYSVVRPRNSGKGHLDGFEVSYQHFFDNLPGVLRGLGLQTNYTYITGQNSVADTGEKEPYTQVSKNSYNIIGIYERGPFSARLAYNYRGSYVDTFNGPNVPDAFGTPLRTITVKPTKRVDFSAAYRFSEKFTVTFDITNLANSKYADYFGPDPSLYPRDTRLYDRTFELGARYHF